MTQTRVSDLTADELKNLIQETVTQTIIDFLHDPDEGLELREDIADTLRHSLTIAQTGMRGTPIRRLKSWHSL